MLVPHRRSLDRRLLWIVLLVLVVCGAGLWSIVRLRMAGEQADVELAAESHQRMVEMLDTFRVRALEDDSVFGRKALAEANRRLNALSERSPIDARINALAILGDLELLHGETRLAAEHLEQAYQLLDEVKSQVPTEIVQKALLDVAICQLRLGEVSNCIECNTCDSCILPIQREGIHQIPAPSERAVQVLEQFLELQPDSLTARWLLNIAYMTLGKYPEQVPARYMIPEEAFATGAEFPRFLNRAKDFGVNTVTLSGGVIADDFNGDGWIDLVTSDWSAAGQLRYFANTGDGSFRDETVAAGLIGIFGGLNLVQADYDNDGALDILVLRGAWRGDAGQIPNSLLKNDGSGRFRDVTLAVGLAARNFPTQTAAWADYDHDGDLDLFVGNEAFPCQLYRNDGGQFVDVAEEAGVTNNRFTKGCTWGDFDGDGYPDLYVSNYGSPASISGRRSGGGWFEAVDGQPNRLYRNNRDGTFTDVAEELGVTRPLLGFPTWFWDVNNDGNLDLFAASYSGNVEAVAAQFLGLPQAAEIDRLYLGDGRGGFSDVTNAWGIDRVTSAMGANFGDLDNDGFDDFYLGTGAPEYQSLVPNVMYRNRNGNSFEDVTAAGGFGHLQKGHAIAIADFDNDGDQDIYCVLGGAYPGDAFANALFINPGNDHHYVKVDLRGVVSNRFGVGARIKVVVESPEPAATPDKKRERTIYKWVNSGGSFGANPLRKEIGLGTAERILSLEVYWPTTNQTQRFGDLPVDRTIRITEGEQRWTEVGSEGELK